MMLPQFYCLFSFILFLECRSYSHLSAPTLHSVGQFFSQQFVRSTTGIPTIESAGASVGDTSIADEKNRIIEIGHRNLRMISCFLLSTGFFSLNPVAAFAEAPQPAMMSIQTKAYIPTDRAVNLVFSSLPAAPLSTTPINKNANSFLYSTISLSNSALHKPEIQIQNPQLNNIQTQVNMPSNVREMIAKSASNIPGN